MSTKQRANDEGRAARWADKEGLPFPLGATFVAEQGAYNFALYSRRAANVELLLYSAPDVAKPVLVYRFDYLRNKSGRIWHCRIPRDRMRGAMYYAYRIEPAGADDGSRRVGRDKILLDPYAKSVFFPKDFDTTAACRPGSNAGKAPLGVLTGDSEPFDWRGDRRYRHEADAVIYELHVRGFTNNPNSGVSDRVRGTYAGVIEKIAYLKDLGVTVAELMPVFQFDPGGGDYWGYGPLNFFAPHHGYVSSSDVRSQHNEFREMVSALHKADIEVVVDVVYNHTAEGDHRGPVYSFKGIDDEEYYIHQDNVDAPYANFAGAGNTLNCASRSVRKMIVDSVRHWAEEMHVDGFRFDLASVFTRKQDGSINTDDAPVLSDLASDPALVDLRLIAEPWDAEGAYQLGRAFPGIMACQWNGRFRDDVRRFLRGDPGMVPALMRRLYGSDDLFPDDLPNAYHAHQSVNYVTCHDGFTLYDLVSYNHKRNAANGHANADGMNENYSWNCGWEGDESVPPEIAALRKRQIKNFCCLLMLANGTPMLRAGDEFMQTQAGNNNPYNQDNETSWLDWSRLDANRDIFRFFKLMIGFRKLHPSLSRSRFWREDVRWYGVEGAPDLSNDSHSVAFALRGEREADDDLYVMINGYWQELVFEIQENAGSWRRAVDTSLESPFDILEPGSEARVTASQYLAAPRSVVVLVGNSGRR